MSGQAMHEGSSAAGHAGRQAVLQVSKAIATMWELCEDSIVGLGGDEQDREDAAVSALRQAVSQARQAYKRLDMAAKLGLNAVDKLFDRTVGVQDLDEAEE